MGFVIVCYGGRCLGLVEIEPLLPQQIFLCIAAIPPPSMANGSDSVYRKCSKTETMDSQMVIDLPRRAAIVVWVSRKCQEPPWVKLNVDGPFLGDCSSVFCGEVVRDDSGRWKCGFVANFGQATVLCPELWAMCLRGAWDRGHGQLVVESDNVSAVRYVLGREVPLRSLCSLVNAISSLLSRDWNVWIVHMYRKANWYAEHQPNHAKLHSR
ncbi:hypothetical protein GH714_027139 [Hevea brasiliensis]|uniref:RNase H type-1 domain-containing protein n=1 Tax=Hevea brasiliensis TaxID=3981 RepID=A0A6A6NDD9_HEVBR|nr:hypothetical protein GH714_027139 [Hevea brasiliensis]